MPRTTQRYGWRKDHPDERDLKFSIPAPVLLSPIIDLRPKAAPVLNQFALGGCVAHASSSGVDFEVMRRGLARLNPSRLFIYYLAREMESSIESDSGCEIRDAMKAIGKFGVAPESFWPYDISKFAQHPPSACYNIALTHIVQRYYSVPQSLMIMKSCLAAGYPFIVGFTVYESFESNSVAQTGIVPMPNTAVESVLGGHAVLCVGYSDLTRRFIMQNSWGKDWGQKGFFEIPYDYLTNPGLAADMWTIRLVHDIQPIAPSDPSPALIPEIISMTPELSAPSINVKQEFARIDTKLDGLQSSLDDFIADQTRLNFPGAWTTVIQTLKELLDGQKDIREQTKQILDLFSDPEQASAFLIKLTQGAETTAMKDTNMHLKLTVFTSGQATGTLSPINLATGNPAPMPAGETTPVWTASDPSLTLSSSPDGLSCLITAGQVAVSGVTVTATAQSADGTSTLTGTSDPFDIVEAPEVATGFKIVVQ